MPEPAYPVATRRLKGDRSSRRVDTWERGCPSLPRPALLGIRSRPVNPLDSPRLRLRIDAEHRSTPTAAVARRFFIDNLNDLLGERLLSTVLLVLWPTREYATSADRLRDRSAQCRSLARSRAIGMSNRAYLMITDGTRIGKTVRFPDLLDNEVTIR